jgi:hypothetical protein
MQLPRLKQSSTLPIVKASRYWLSLIIAKSEMFAPQSQPVSRAAFLWCSPSNSQLPRDICFAIDAPNIADRSPYQPFKRWALNRRAFPITDTELSDIAKAATTGLSNISKGRVQNTCSHRYPDRVVGEGEYEVLSNIAHRHAAKGAGSGNSG